MERGRRPRAGVKLGYRRGARGASWVAKLVDDGRRTEATLGAADDDGHVAGTLTYSTAIAAALTWAASARLRLASGGEARPDVRSLTVADAVRA